MQLVSVSGHRRLTGSRPDYNSHHARLGSMPPKHLRPISMCRREINKHEGIAVRSAHALPRVLAVGDSRRRSRRCVAARSCRAGSADRSAVVPSSVPSSPPRHSPPPHPPATSPYVWRV